MSTRDLNPMKILFVTSTYPEDIHTCTSGVFKRMKMFMVALSSLAELDILFYVSSDADISHERASRMEQLLEKHWKCKTRVFLCRKSQKYTVDLFPNFPLRDSIKDWWFVHHFYYLVSKREHVAAFEECLERKQDAVFVHRLNSMYPVLLSRKVVPPVFFDLDDIEHKAFVRNLKQPPLWRSKFLQYLKIPSLVWLELRAIALARKTFVCSENDRDYLVKIFKLPDVCVIPNAVEIPTDSKRTTSVNFLFIGLHLYPPNAIAADFLIKKVWPIVKHEIPEAKLIIAGKYPEKITCFHEQHEGVEFRGYIDNLDKLYSETRIVCCPIQSGGGTRVKIIEAAAYGKGIVSTSLGAEGLDFVDGNEIMIRDDHTHFAQACIALIRDRSLCDRIGEAARIKTIELYSRAHVIDRIMNEIQVLDLCVPVCELNV